MLKEFKDAGIILEICINMDSKDLVRGFDSQTDFKRFAFFHKSNKPLQILSTIAQNKSLKIQIRKSESLLILKVWTHKSGFMKPNLKDSYRGFNSQTFLKKIRIVDSICKANNSNYSICFDSEGFVYESCILIKITKFISQIKRFKFN